eukprot:CAMPEP_0119259658 /NCGR_PEP_ID=MMETSP1329-20130426/390_1 /TAXON_ID=114041 /ORGANISM="Genus nov. species nov., Strain RCC1024" /LENGTH=323 /DNA_ID=CAMNT_0007259053 /DNA_START=568 /DNA_END=1541 /DNA_ORIENTATION=-
MHHLARVLCNICERQIPDFDKTSIDSIQLNGNQTMEPHEDDINTTDAMHGNYSGGRLHIYQDGKDKPSTPYDIRNRVLRFNGQITHSVEAFSAAQPDKDATRISFVLYRRLPGRPTRKPVDKALHAVSTTPSSWDTEHLFTMPSLHELWHHDVALVFDTNNPKNYKRARSRRRFLQYFAMTWHLAFFTSQTPTFGLYNLYVEHFGCYQTLLPARKSIHKRFDFSKASKGSSSSYEFAEDLFRASLPDSFKLAKETEYLLKLAREDSAKEVVSNQRRNIRISESFFIVTSGSLPSECSRTMNSPGLNRFAESGIRRGSPLRSTM